MPTQNINITKTWTQLATSADADVLISTTFPNSIEYATTAANAAPTVVGHTLSNREALTRSVIGAGYIWARIAADVDTRVISSVQMVVTK